jgi:class 3 adenylate cyclase
MRFCGNCGSQLNSSLERGAISSVDLTAPNAEFGMLVGSDLMHRFRQAGIEAVGKRRSVTVLFADLCDYTGLSGKIDDESLYEIIQSYIHMLAEKVYKYEGMVDKITGDGVMALFGAPIAHENPAERAVRAALEMRVGLEQLNQDLKILQGEKLQMHCGLNRGTVIVGGIGSDMLLDYTAIGDSVNLARRLQETADPDTILASESVYQTTQALFDYQEMAGLKLKGYQHAEKGYQVRGG